MDFIHDLFLLMQLYPVRTLKLTSRLFGKDESFRLSFGKD
jgi:hypothetical protein